MEQYLKSDWSLQPYKIRPKVIMIILHKINQMRLKWDSTGKANRGWILAHSKTNGVSLPVKLAALLRTRRMQWNVLGNV